MKVWAVRAGSDGEYEEYALSEGVTMVDFGLRDSVADFGDREALRDYLNSESQPYAGRLRSAANAASQIWRFAREIQTGDMLLLPRKKTRDVAVGRVIGDYRLDPDMPFDACHARDVEWLASGVPRESFDDGILTAIRSMLTVFQIKREGVETRISNAVAAYLAGASADETPPAAEEEAAPDDETPEETESAAAETSGEAAPIISLVKATEEPEDAAPDEGETPEEADADDEPGLDALIRDRVVRHVRARFGGARLAGLTAAILRTYGYTAAETPPEDGERAFADILAGKGDMGFDEPRLLARVSLDDAPADIDDYRRLSESVRAVGARHGLLVSMSGFSDEARRANKSAFFHIRLWDAADVSEKMMSAYDDLPPAVRDEIPPRMRRILAETE